MNLFLMLFAAAPETCCDMIPDAKERKGSIFSARPSREKMRQWCWSMTVCNFGSTVARCAQASSNMHFVVVVALALVFEGESSNVLYSRWTWVPPGVTRVAFV